MASPLVRGWGERGVLRVAHVAHQPNDDAHARNPNAHPPDLSNCAGYAYAGADDTGAKPYTDDSAADPDAHVYTDDGAKPYAVGWLRE